jgi:hypothetical protein
MFVEVVSKPALHLSLTGTCQGACGTSVRRMSAAYSTNELFAFFWQIVLRYGDNSAHSTEIHRVNC